MVVLRNTVKWLGAWVVLLILSMLAAEGLHLTNPNVDPNAMLVTLSLCFSWLAVLLMPDLPGPTTRNGVLILWAVIAAAGFFALTLSLLYDEPVHRGLRLSGGVLVLVLLFGFIQSLVMACTSSRANAMILFTVILGVFFAAPLYLGVVAEAAPGNTPIVNAIVAASPVSYVAAIVDYDYLHSSWFYRNTPFGGLRFDYPTAGKMTFFYLIITLLLVGANLLHNRLQTRKRSQ